MWYRRVVVVIGCLLAGWLAWPSAASAQDLSDPAIDSVQEIGNGAKRVVVKQGATWTVRIGDNETLSNLLVDVDRPGANFHAFADGSGWRIENLGVEGTIKSNYALVLDGENGTVEHVYLGDGAKDGTRVMGVWIDHDETQGPIDFREVHISGFPNNGIYGSPTVEEDRGGIVNIYDSYFDSNNISNFKLGSPLGPCEVVNTVIRTDNAATPNSRGQVNKRGMWALDNPGGGHPNRHRVVLKDVDLLGRIVAEPGAIVELQNTRFDGSFTAGGDPSESGDPDGELVGSSAGQPDLTPPQGVPMTAKEAATGAGAGGGDDPSDQPQEPILELPKVAGSISVDGRLDEADWRAAPNVSFTDGSGESDNTANVRGLWTSDTLYFGWRIEDGSIESSSSTPPYREDSVEFFLDPNDDGGAKLASDDLHVIVSTEKQVFAKRDGADVADAVGLDSAVRETGSGYVVELKVEWSALAASPSEGLALGALFANGDRDGGSSTQFAKPDISPFAQPSQWPPIQLAGANADVVADAGSGGASGGTSSGTGGSTTADAGYGSSGTGTSSGGSTSSDATTSEGSGAGTRADAASTAADGGRPGATRTTGRGGCTMVAAPYSSGDIVWIGLLGFLGLVFRREE